SSLKSGSAAWLCLFTEHNFEGGILKVIPSTSIDNLSDDTYMDSGGHTQDFNDTFVSFAMYDACPNFWDTNSPENEAGDCWVKLYATTRSPTGTSRFTLAGAGEVVNMACIDNYQYPVFNSVTHETYMASYTPKSLTTGPNTWVKLYSDIDFKSVI